MATMTATIQCYAYLDNKIQDQEIDYKYETDKNSKLRYVPLKADFPYDELLRIVYEEYHLRDNHLKCPAFNLLSCVGK